MLKPLSSVRLRDFRRDGYLVLPGLVSRPLIDAALREINCFLGKRLGHEEEAPASDRRGEFWSEIDSSPALMNLLFKSPAWAAAESMIGRGQVERPALSQVALRFPVKRAASTAPNFHVDGVETPGGVLEQIRRHSFTMTVGVLLSDVAGELRGNFTVSPGSHAVIGAYFRRRGIVSLRKEIPRELALAKPRQITGAAGDVVLCHYQLAHDRVPNLSAQVRYMVFFRLRHVLHAERAERALKDIWLEWAGLRAA